MHPTDPPSSRPRSVAIVGASANRSKFGNKAVRAFKAAGWKVWPVHPTALEIEGISAWASLEALPGPPDVVSLYLPPAAGSRIIHRIPIASELWLNPGTESDELLDAAEKRGLHVRRCCSIREIGRAPSEFPD